MPHRASTINTPRIKVERRFLPINFANIGSPFTKRAVLPGDRNQSALSVVTVTIYGKGTFTGAAALLETLPEELGKADIPAQMVSCNIAQTF